MTLTVQMGARMNHNYQAHAGIDPSAFPSGLPVYSGHYHLPHTVEGTAITYVGSPYQGGWVPLRMGRTCGTSLCQGGPVGEWGMGGGGATCVGGMFMPGSVSEWLWWLWLWVWWCVYICVCRGHGHHLRRVIVPGSVTRSANTLGKRGGREGGRQGGKGGGIYAGSPFKGG